MTRVEQRFDYVKIGLASPERIRQWGERTLPNMQVVGEVTKPETINYRTLKPEMDGLFCERIFGPAKDWECHCGKYKRVRHRGIVCERCGVEVTESRVRRHRMGYIKLAAPVTHVWYLKGIPSYMATLLDMPLRDVEQIVYFNAYVVLDPGNASNLSYKQLLTEDQWLELEDQIYAEDSQLEGIEVDIGAEAVERLLANIELEPEAERLREEIANSKGQKRAKLIKRLRVVDNFVATGARPDWMVLQYIPVIPPDLRPMVQLDGGRFATSDLNDLYRRVINRNNRLARLQEILAPEIIVRNEKRMLQEAVDALIDNGRRGRTVVGANNRPLKSLSDIIEGKQGRFRQNLLGKRVDYSGRSVIVVGPNLKIHQCGLPKEMAIELFQPFVINRLIKAGLVNNIKAAKKLIQRNDPAVWDVLQDVIRDHPVMLNRAPTLHRLGIQAFEPILVDGRAIQLHPLVCPAFNADFDGDQMAVHVPLSNAAILEAQLLMLASHNILNPQNGTPITLPSQDMVLGLYYLTKGKRNIPTEAVKGEGMRFYNADEVIIALNEGVVDLHAWIKVKSNVREDDGTIVTKTIETTVGRVMFNLHTPEKVGFINELLTKKSLRTIIGEIIKFTDIPTTVRFLDDIKGLGFRTAFRGGLSFNPEDLIVPEIKQQMLNAASSEVDEVWENYNMGLITNNERYNQIIDVWSRVDTKVTETLIREMAADKQGFNSVYMMLDSGARGSKQQIKQLSGIRGLMAKPRKSGSSGSEIIENPILSNFKDGLNVLEYFISTHGARKGLADTALKTADAGYLTRRLVDVAQDVIVREEDCGTLRGIAISALKENDDIVEPLLDRIVGRTSLHEVYDTKGNMLIGAGEEISHFHGEAVENAGIETVEIRSVLTCESKRGTCAKCYGINLATGKMAQSGDAVGIIAAQSIGEPGTQLTLRTFHVGGAASSSAIESQMLAKFDGKIEFDSVRTTKYANKEGEEQVIVITRMGEMRIVDEDGVVLVTSEIPYGSTLKVKNGQKLKKGDEICSWDPFNAVIISEISGTIRFESVIDGITYREEADEQSGLREKVIIETKDKTKIPAILVEGKDIKNYNVPVGSHLIINDGDTIQSGQILVKIPRIMGRSRDITGGLPRVTELFEARNPSNPAVVAEIDGVVSFGGVKRGNREINIESKDGIIKKYLVPLTKHIIVQEGDYIKAGTPLSDGSITPSDILAIKGPFAVQEYLVNEIQEVYRLQGVKINDKHVEVIVRQMMRKVTIEDQGDTKFLEGDVVDKLEFQEENDWMFDKVVVTDAGSSEKLLPGQIATLREIREENSTLRRADKTLLQYRNAQPATSSPNLLGITKASLGTFSWISAASFQETTKVLSQAAIAGKSDYMWGLKENVITGNLIPAGTGMKEFDNFIVGSKDEYEILQNSKEMLQFDDEE